MTSKWFKRTRAALGMGLIWAMGWGLVGGLVELADNVTPGGLEAIHFIDMWPQTLALLGFPRGVVFAVVVMLAKGHRRFEELTLARFTAWGAVAGVVLGLVGLAGGADAGYFVITTLLSAIAGAASLAVARMAEGRGSLDAGDATRELGAGRPASPTPVGRPGEPAERAGSREA